MRARGINYDTGFLPGNASRPFFDADAVRHDLGVIRNDLHCDAVRVSGGEPERLRVAAEAAKTAGLEVWFAPFPVDLPLAELVPYFEHCADLASSTGADVFVAGCEISAFCPGFLAGDTYGDRLAGMATFDWASSLGPLLEKLNELLASVAATVRRRFDGRLTYASAPWEFVDWTPFDLVGVDAYRAAYNASVFREEVRGHLAHGKPVAVTEFGTCPYRGAAELGGMAWQAPPDAVADEEEQVRYFTELLDVFESEGVDTALWFTFAGFSRLGRDDLGSYGVVRMLDEVRWEPRAVFSAMAARYAGNA